MPCNNSHLIANLNALPPIPRLSESTWMGSRDGDPCRSTSLQLSAHRLKKSGTANVKFECEIDFETYLKNCNTTNMDSNTF